MPWKEKIESWNSGKKENICCIIDTYYNVAQNKRRKGRKLRCKSLNKSLSLFFVSVFLVNIKMNRQHKNENSSLIIWRASLHCVNYLLFWLPGITISMGKRINHWSDGTCPIHFDLPDESIEFPPAINPYRHKSKQKGTKKWGTILSKQTKLIKIY